MAYMDFSGFQDLADAIKTWAAGKYEPQVRFSSTPIYNITLDEDVVTSEAEPYVINLNDDYHSILVVSSIPSATSGNSALLAHVGDGTTIVRSTLRTTSLAATSLFSRHGNYLYDEICGGNSSTVAGSKQLYRAAPAPVFSEDGYNKLSFYGQTLPAGMEITVYGCK